MQKCFSRTCWHGDQAQVVIEDFSAAAVEIFLRFFYSGVVELRMQHCGLL